MFAQARRLALVATHADVEVIALRKDPSVTASNDCELEHHRVREACVVREVGLEGYAVHDLAAQVERASRRAVAAVGADHDARLHVRAVDADRIRAHVGDLHAVTYIGTCFSGLLEQEVVEPPPLRHQRKRRARGAFEAWPVLEAAFEPVDDILDDRLDRERQKPGGSSRDAATARLVARKDRAIDEQDARTRSREPVGRGRAGGAAADDRDVVGHA